jgi:MFS family permease
MQDQGFTLADSTKVATTLAGFAVIGKLVYGFFAEKYPIRYVLGFSLIPAGMSLLILVYAQKLTSLYIYAVLHGISMGGFPPMLNVIFASYFGRTHMGAIRGFATPFGNVVGAVSPVLAAWMWTLSGNYSWAFVLFALSWIGGGILALFTQPPIILESRSQKI